MTSEAALRTSLIYLLALVLMLHGVAHVRAEEGISAAPAFKPQRYDESYVYLHDPARRSDYFDPIKYIPLTEERNVYLSIGGDARLRCEYFHNPSWGAAPQDNDGYWLQRYLVHRDLHITAWFRAFAQFQSALINDRVGGPRPTDKDILELHQGLSTGGLRSAMRMP
ncbi:MAG TPA: alginate export family protein [Candidatus Binatia bacterium]|nr:alginate export family protein [Candidatus Binatia bacterium]